MMWICRADWVRSADVTLIMTEVSGWQGLTLRAETAPGPAVTKRRPWPGLCDGSNGPTTCISGGWPPGLRQGTRAVPLPLASTAEATMIRKLKSGQYRLYSKKVNPKTGKRRNLGTFDTREAAEQHEREVQFFKRH